jgi:hypothetical protein
MDSDQLTSAGTNSLGRSNESVPDA